MYVHSIVFKREQNSEWEKGFYIGEYQNSDKSFIIDADYKPIIDCIWDYHNDYSFKTISFRCDDN